MFKRLLALLVSLALLISAVPFSAFAEEPEEARIRTQIRRVYRRALNAADLESFHGLCGLMTSYQLWALGITPYPLTQDGKDMYDYYKDAELSAGGYCVNAYSARDYSLEAALNLVTHCGTRDVYNLMVCFQKTDTEAGKQYGHALLIHAILDGTVYFVEGYYTGLGGAEGNVLTCSISRFAEFYSNWLYEGLVVFGNNENADFCDTYATDIFVSAKGRSWLVSQPCQVGADGCWAIRQTVPGEKLHVSDVYAQAGAYFYRIEDGDRSCYLPVAEAGFVQTVSNGVALENANLPAALEQGQGYKFSGTVTSRNSLLRSLSVTVADAQGNPVQGGMISVYGRMADLGALNGAVDLAALEQGAYTFTVTAEVENSMMSNGVVLSRLENVVLSSAALTVGQTEATIPAGAEPVKDGWVWENDCWFYYQDGAPRTGWFCYEGVDYYFLENGAAATGWHEINGRWRCFTPGGALRTGWVDTDEGRCYMLSNGAAAMGWRQIDGSLYFFGDTGLMATEGTAVFEGVEYTFGPAGVAVRAE